MINPLELAKLRALEARAEELRITAKAIQEAAGIPDLLAEAKALEAEAEHIRGTWCEAWGAVYDAAVACPSLEVDPLPEGVSFSRRSRRVITDPDLIPRECMAPVKSALKDDTPGVTVERYWSVSVTS